MWSDYIVQRLADEGINDCFGVAGDYAFPICDAVERNPKIKWIGCSNELDASYAADGYGRVRGAAMLATTYAVGELSALNGVMGAKAERSLVFHVVGMPSFQNQRVGKIMHHTFEDGVFAGLAWPLTNASVRIGSAPPRLRRNGVTSASGARVPQSYKLAEPREVDSPSITQPAQTGVFPRVLGKFAVEPRAEREPAPESDLHASRRK